MRFLGFGGIFGAVSDPEIERIEAELHRSRTEAWDVETFLANRHRAKIEALESPKSQPQAAWHIFREITDPLFVWIGWVAVLNGFVFWMLKIPPFG